MQVLGTNLFTSGIYNFKSRLDAHPLIKRTLIAAAAAFSSVGTFSLTTPITFQAAVVVTLITFPVVMVALTILNRNTLPSLRVEHNLWVPQYAEEQQKAFTDVSSIEDGLAVDREPIFRLTPEQYGKEQQQKAFPDATLLGDSLAVHKATKEDLSFVTTLTNFIGNLLFNSSIQRVSMTNFTNELSSEIFKFLPLENLGQISQVCKRFNLILDKQNELFWCAKAAMLSINLDLSCQISTKEQTLPFVVDLTNHRLIINNPSYMDDMPDSKSEFNRNDFYLTIFDKYIPKNYYLEHPLGKLDSLFSFYRLLYKENDKRKQIVTQMKIWEHQSWPEQETYDTVKATYKPFRLFFKKENGYREITR